MLKLEKVLGKYFIRIFEEIELDINVKTNILTFDDTLSLLEWAKRNISKPVPSGGVLDDTLDTKR